jgi:hypothetical protein
MFKMKKQKCTLCGRPTIIGQKDKQEYCSFCGNPIPMNIDKNILDFAKSIYKKAKEKSKDIFITK